MTMEDENHDISASDNSNHLEQDSERIEAKIGKLLLRHNLTFAAAESCTGGLILHRMTNIPGSSAYVMGGMVTYSNEAKLSLLNVRTETLILHGAVSEQTATEMVRGALDAFQVDMALSVTGIAGPGGGTELKPVGLTYIGLGWAKQEKVQVQRFQWNGDRESNKASSAQAALELLYQYLMSLENISTT